jgi:broad specificity phosphatase PhoE
MRLVTLIYLVQHGDKERVAGDPGLTALGARQAAVTASHGGATTDLLRTLLGDDALSPQLLDQGIPACAITTLDDLGVAAIASTAHLTEGRSWAERAGPHPPGPVVSRPPGRTR